LFIACYLLDNAMMPSSRSLKSPPATSPLVKSPLAAIIVAVIIAIVVSLFIAALWLSKDYESRKIQALLQAQTEIESAAMRSRLREAEASLELIAIELRAGKPDFSLDAAVQELMKQTPPLLRLEIRQVDERGGSQEMRPPVTPAGTTNNLPNILGTRQLAESNVAMQSAIAAERINYSRPYYVQTPPDRGVEIIDIAVPISMPIAAAAERSADTNEAMKRLGNNRLVIVGSFSAPLLLKSFVAEEFQRNNQVLLVESDGTFIARLTSGPTPLGFYSAKAPLDLPGISMVIRANSPLSAPNLPSNLLTGVLFLLGLGLALCGAMLWRLSRRRASAEQALANQYAFRAAMENSLVTGLRARDLEGRVTYVNPAFCEMVGYSAAELTGQKAPMPYWAPEGREDYERRYAAVLAGTITREAYETTFMRKGGERLTALIFEAPLIDHTGQQSGWMSSILDVSEQRKIEETNRLQQETIAANARLAMLGEVATALSHELNQPLAAITSYATAAENLLARQGNTTSIAGALEKIRTQAERAGRVIKSVHDFVRYRSVEQKAVNVFDLMRRIEPMIKLQTRRAGVELVWKCPKTCEVAGDGILLEQVILNLTRNAAEAMEHAVMPQGIHKSTRPIVEVLVNQATNQPNEPTDRVEITVMDRGAGVPTNMQDQLFDAFKSNKHAGMGIGLSFCRSVMEQLGGSIQYQPRELGGSIFVLSLPASISKFELKVDAEKGEASDAISTQ
jgi:two-component system, LuxR family, sensor histidine kinase DctS